MALVPIEMHWLADEGVDVEAHGVVTRVGELMVCSGSTTAWRVERTTKLARDSLEPSVFINLQHFGSSLVVQHGREAVERPGDLVMYDATSPYTCINETGMTGDFLRIPHSALALPHDMIRDACAVNLSPGHPLTKFTHDYLRRLADPDLLTSMNADFVARPGIELIRALILTHAGADTRRIETPESLHLRILEYAREHLYEPDISADQIAAAHYISVRYLYKILAEQGISLAAWIRTRRLESCRQALVDARPDTTISTVARRFGFTDMSSFSRSFRAEYGMTPREWRGLAAR